MSDSGAKDPSDDGHLRKIRDDAKKRMYKYVAPKWAEDLRWKPRFKINIRRLELNLAEALEKGCDTVIGCGPITSNNCRTLAVCGKELGFAIHLCLHNAPLNQRPPFNGNHYLDTLVGAHFHLSPDDTITNSIKEQKELYHQLSIDGHSPYIVGIDEPGDVGLFGYIDCFEELIKQGVTEDFTDLVLTCSTGLTSAAFIIGNHRNGRKIR
ncbi:uncharacterized protein [Apostichopus japonicus]|uniref:uncharacterized protein isoform X2 n=1 Tax=Stichopus japonicus TaxID=307972 RepID=UPI003AB279E7